MSFINANKVVRFKLKQLSLHFKVNLSTKKKTHYETLGISPGATYSEIKTAYYDLTLKYHPDKNKSHSAKAMFQEISNAYDVLSKYESRKNYDRTLKIERSTLYEQSQMRQKDVKRHRPKDPTEYGISYTEIYNFDEWLKAHYKESFRRHRKAQEKIADIEKEIRDENIGNVKTALGGLFIMFILVLLGYLYRSVVESKKPSLKIKRQE